MYLSLSYPKQDGNFAARDPAEKAKKNWCYNGQQSP